MQGIFFKQFENSYIPNILLEIYMQRIYAPYLEGKKDLTILDVGANIGLFTFYASQFASKVYSIEPSEEHIGVLAHMIKYNDIHDKVHFSRLAIAGKEGEVTLNHNENVTMFSLSDAVKDPKLEGEKVEAITLLTFLDRNHIEHVDFMKLDVEGEEMNIVCGEGFEEASKRIESLVVEWHAWTGRNPSQLVTALNDYGYDVVAIPADATLFGAKKRSGE